MLIKLFKNELKATGRIFLPLFGLLAIFAAVSRFTVRQWDSASTLFTGILMVLPVILYGCIIAALGAVCFVLLVQRFKKNLLDDEGYLMHTLPVRTGQHIFCKLVTSFLWTLLTSVAITLSIFFVATTPGNWANVWEAVQEFFRNPSVPIGFTAGEFFTWLVVLILTGSAKSILTIYAGLSIGQIASRRKLSAAIAVTVACVITEQIIGYGVIQLLQEHAYRIAFLRDNFPLFGIDFTKTMFRLFVINSVAFGALYAWICMRMLKRHLNLA